MGRPLIGITGRHYQYNAEIAGVFVGDGYTKGVYEAGGLPVVLPYTEDEQQLQAWVEHLDGLILSGGEDIDPSYFKENPMIGLGEVSPERDRLESIIGLEMLSLGKPVLGICRGIQVMNVIAGGSLYQDLPRQIKGMQHSQKAPRSHLAHEVEILRNSLLYRLFGTTSVKVNTFHHQAVKDVAPGFIVSAKAKDGVVEAIESTKHPFAVGVQWHPENLWEKYPIFHKLFIGLVQAAEAKKTN
jgi:putative glutamine amidotransferase